MWFDVQALNLTKLSNFLAGFTLNLTCIHELAGDSVNFIATILEDIPAVPLPHIEFTEFQLDLVKTLIGFICVNLLLIWYFWNRYGEVITDKFIRPSTLKEIEELKESVARLKLPKDYTPRI